MAAVWATKSPKNKKGQKAVFSSEFLKDDRQPAPPLKENIGLRGILGLGQPVEIHRNLPETNSWNKEFLLNSHLDEQEQILSADQKRELEKQIADLISAIKQLVGEAKDVGEGVIQAIDAPIIEANIYQLSVVTRIKKIIEAARQDVSHAALWVEAFAAKKKKRNYFWSMFANKKKGGEQFFFSEESGLARAGS